jgi:hypothetical protein
MSTRGNCTEFGPYRLFPAERQLLKGETPVQIGSREFDILIALVERAGQVVTKRELFARVWPDVVVEESSVSGWPWATTVVVEWRDFATLAGGIPYVNDGAHAIQIRWSKVVVLHAYLDTQIIVDAMRFMAAGGVAEAVAPKIED